MLRDVEEAFGRYSTDNGCHLFDMNSVRRILQAVGAETNEIQGTGHNNNLDTVQNEVQGPEQIGALTPQTAQKSLKDTTFPDTPIGIVQLDDPTLRQSVESQADLFSQNVFDFTNGHYLENLNAGSNDHSESFDSSTQPVPKQPQITEMTPIFQNRRTETTGDATELLQHHDGNNNNRNDGIDNSDDQKRSKQQENNKVQKGSDNNASKDFERQPDNTTNNRMNITNMDENYTTGTTVLNPSDDDSDSTGKNSIETQTTRENNSEADNYEDNNSNIGKDNKNTNKVSPDKVSLDQSSDNHPVASDESYDEAPKTRKTNKTKYLCKNGCQKIVSTDNPKYCENPHRLWKAVCHGCGVTISRSVMKATGQVYHCNCMGVYEKGVLACSFVMCGKCYIQHDEVSGKQRRRTRGV